MRSRQTSPDSGSRWAVHPGLVGLGWVLTIAIGTVTAFTALSGDRPGAFLLGVGTLVLAAATGHATVVRPRLSVEERGIRVRTLGGPRHLEWNEVRFRLLTHHRFGRDVPVLELESGDLMVFGWIELGTDPRDVYDALLAARES